MADVTSISPALSRQVQSFVPLSPEAFDTDLSPQEQKTLQSIKDTDFEDRLSLRRNIARYLILLLFMQNLFVFVLVSAALFTHEIKDLQLIFSVLTGATLSETAFAVYTIVKFLFKEIPYTG